MSHLAQPDTLAATPVRKLYPRSLDGKVALVIGGAGAIGAATSRLLADAGATMLGYSTGHIIQVDGGRAL